MTKAIPLMYKAVFLMVALLTSYVIGWSHQKALREAEVASLKATHAGAMQKMSDESLRAYKAMEETKDAANKQREAESTAAKASAVRAATESDRLRKQLATVPDRISTATESALREYAATSGELLGECTRAYQEVAGQADTHAIDVRALLNAWPTEGKEK